ncbi:helix-turn-helix transcriptional regulator [Nocardia cyriacigeorgica]|uniref:Helix-turn-helix transcriptional regulator n=1 Tax=Nocardia cyriacigeorgica TaxID=135487 RepID=A0A6P1D640_9NOCA|nr:helix-turn-helix domain-containing protein [Nocardia cyriacigeorgica]NEW38549.1 helix-turn-helix transcriptional regulator [Nocardia cyriacigeorgica]NEW46106.1 helix-turn-helix transcriptional regulator [Nocardia cyriacigeorgica]NEW49576.1 helix-turn-helix transcriptional regulator [Nocardia cyriacigeorgica]NEW58623.1 helix-turn-helix transcriptional regulator [Nocardia cyriacigeorgica]
MGINPVEEAPIGSRIKRLRERAGMSRAVLAGLVGRSTEWLKAVENGRLQPPRLPMLLHIAHALELADLAELTGNGHAVPVAVFAGERHGALTEVQAALTDYRLAPPARAANVVHLEERLRQAWTVRHASPDHRTQLGTLLPALIRDAQGAVRAGGTNRRTARRTLAGVYQLADFYVAYQPAPELVWMVADRALSEGYEADDPYVIACGAWAMAQALRDSGRWEEAIAIARTAIERLTPYLDRDDTIDDWRGISGALHAEIAYVHARRGRHGEAWSYWENAATTARLLGPSYRHVQTSFSIPVMAAHATTLGVELRRSGEALRAARGFDADQITSIPRRSRHFIEVARAHYQRDEPVAALALLDKSARTAPETIKYNGHARDILHVLMRNPPSGMRNDVNDLCRQVGLVPA